MSSCHLRSGLQKKDEKGNDGREKAKRLSTSLEDKGGVLLLLVTTELEVLATLEGNVRAVLALGALETQNDLLGGLGLLVEDGLGLTTVTLLLPVVTTLTLSVERSLTSLVLGDLVGAVLENDAQVMGTESVECSRMTR